MDGKVRVMSMAKIKHLNEVGQFVYCEQGKAVKAAYAWEIIADNVLFELFPAIQKSYIERVAKFEHSDGIEHYRSIRSDH